MNALQIAAASSPRRTSTLRTSVATPPSRQASATMVAKFQGLLLDEDTALPVAAALTLADTIARSTAKTLYQLCREVRAASETLQQWKRAQPIDTRCGRLNAISLRAGCELFLQYVTRASLDIPDFDDCREVLRQRGEHFASLSKRSRDKIAASTLDFIHQGSVVLVFGYSRVVIKSLLRVAQSGRQFRVIAMEGRPEANGWKTARALQEEGGLDVSVIVDAAMGFVLEEVDMVLVGAEAVVESGGIVNQVGLPFVQLRCLASHKGEDDVPCHSPPLSHARTPTTPLPVSCIPRAAPQIGTNALAVVAAAQSKPFYVAVETYKFARLFPLYQRDLPDNFRDEEPLSEPQASSAGGSAPATASAAERALPPSTPCGAAAAPLLTFNPRSDYTPPKYITLLFTDIGVFTPSAVSDELIKLYH